MADVKTFIAVSQAEARQLAEMLTQIENQIANVCGRTVEDGEGNTTVRQGAIQRAEALADVHYRAAMAEAGEEVAEGTVISLPRFALESFHT